MADVQILDPPAPALDPGAPVGTTLWWRGWGLWFWAAAGWLVGVMCSAAFAPLLPLHDPDAPNYSAISTGPSATHPLGTDDLGRDTLSRIVYGGQVTLMVSLGAVALALVCGVTLGVVAAFYQGWIERLISWAIDVLLAFPALILAVALAAALGSSATTVALAIGVVVIPSFARVARASTLQIMQRDFVLAARSLGARNRRIILSEVLPNVVPAVLTLALTLIGLVAVIEGGLSFLGLGVPLPRPTWGGLIQAGQGQIFTNPSQVLAPSAVLFITVLALNILAEGVSRRLGLDKGSS